MSELKDQILTHALNLLRHQEIHTLSLRKIAQDLGVSHQAPYHHYKTKEDLICAIQEQAYERLSQRYFAILVQEDDPFKAFQQLGIGYIQLCIKTPGYFKALSVNLERNEQTKALIGQCIDVMQSIARKAANASSREINVDDLLLTCRSCAHGFAALYLSERVKISKSKLDQEIERRTEFLSNLLR